MSSYYCSFCKTLKDSNCFIIQRDSDYQFFTLQCNACNQVTIQWECKCCLKQLFCKIGEINEIQKCYNSQIDYRFYSCLFCQSKIFASGKNICEFTKYTCNICQNYQYFVHCPICRKGYDIKNINQLIKCTFCQNEFQWMKCITEQCNQEAYCLKNQQQINLTYDYKCKGCLISLLIFKCVKGHQINAENKQLQTQIFCNQCKDFQNQFICSCGYQQYINKDTKQFTCEKCVNQWDILSCPKCNIGRLKYKEADLLQGVEEQKCIQRTFDVCKNCNTQFRIIYCCYCEQIIINQYGTQQHRCQQQVHKEEQSNKCTICYLNQLQLLLQPCSHLIFCQTCYTKYRQTKNTCPICKKKIDSTMKVYV